MDEAARKLRLGPICALGWRKAEDCFQENCIQIQGGAEEEKQAKEEEEKKIRRERHKGHRSV